MKKILNNKKDNELKKNQYLKDVATKEIDYTLLKTHSSLDGLNQEIVNNNRLEFGENVIVTKKKKTVLKRIFESYINPFTAILLFLAIISLFTDVILVSKEEQSFVTIIIVTMVIVSGTLKFIQDSRSSSSAAKLAKMVKTTTRVKRDGREKEIPLEEVVVGDIIVLSSGDMIPADLRLFKTKDLFISQSSLTGESEPIEKYSVNEKEDKVVTEYNNLAFMGSNVISGFGMGIVINTGSNTLFGTIVKGLDEKN